jgi:hypothetical protein
MSTIYAPLHPTEPQIRLLTLEPGQFDEDIECSLRTVSLNDNPEFVALSYLWGDTNITLPVTVGGSVLQVTTNLEAALRHLRWNESPRILWVDAICINQQDIEEKNLQVPMMRSIYRCATSVISWFGHGDERVAKAITWTQYHILHQTSEATHEWSEMETIASTDDNGQLVKVSSLSSALLGCLDLARHEYWGRMWTFQEFILPQESPICVYGHFTFSLLEMLEAAEPLYECLDDYQSAGDATLMNKSLDLSKFAQQEYLQWSNNMTARAAQQLFLKREIRLEDCLDYLLMITADRKSSDPRDRIYALYGFLPTLSEKFSPDYSKTEKQVIMEAISHEFGTGSCECLWIAFSPRSDRFSSTIFPSWCPDFDRPVRNFYRTQACEALDFSSSSIIHNKICADLTTLHLWSWNLGSCKVLGQIDVENESELMKLVKIKDLRLNSARKLWAFLADLKAHDNAMAQELSRKFARCAVISIEGHNKVSDEELLTALEAVSNYKATILDSGEFASQAVRLLSSIKYMSRKVACVVTSHGCVAFAPIDTKDNDLMILPPYPIPPMVLRKECSDSSHSDREFYLMVGPAQVNIQVNITDAKGADVAEAVSKVREFGGAEYLIH